MTIEKAELRRIQYLIVLLSCLPRDGKCREVPEERRVVWWQGANENMEAAIRELKAVESMLGETWVRTVIPAGSFHEGGS